MDTQFFIDTHFVMNRQFVIATRQFVIDTRQFVIATRQFVIATRQFVIATRQFVIATRQFVIATRQFVIATLVLCVIDILVTSRLGLSSSFSLLFLFLSPAPLSLTLTTHCSSLAHMHPTLRSRVVMAFAALGIMLGTVSSSVCVCHVRCGVCGRVCHVGRGGAVASRITLF